MDGAEQKIRQVMLKDGRYRTEAYDFILKAVEIAAAELERRRHLSAVELLTVIRKVGHRDFGGFESEVFAEWGIASASDIGNVVYNLIEVEALFAGKGDKRSDFDIDFELSVPAAAEPGFTAEIPIID